MQFFWLSNLVLLMKGEAPIGADGKPMNLHHWQPGKIVLTPESFYKKFSGLLHLRNEQHMKQPEAINRHHFTWWKEHALKALGEHLQRRTAANITGRIRARKIG